MNRPEEVMKMVSKAKISYNEETDEITIQKNDITLKLKMGEHECLYTLWKITPYFRYKRFLLMEQDFRCAECGKDLEGLPAREYALHHDPPLGQKGARYIDFQRSTRNRIICKECHKKRTQEKGKSRLKL